MEQVNILHELLQLVINKYKCKPSINRITNQQKHKAAQLLLLIEDFLSNVEFSEEEYLDFAFDSLEDFSDSEETVDSQNSHSSQEYRTPLKIGRRTYNLDTMKRVVKVFQEQGMSGVRRNFKSIHKTNIVHRFKKYIQQNGTKAHKFNEVDRYVTSKFTDAREHGLTVHDNDLRQWARHKAKEINYTFTASRSWAKYFKTSHRIVSRKITKLINNSSDKATQAEIIKKSEEFVLETKNTIFSSRISPSNVINTDQSGFEYEVNLTRSLEFKGTKDAKGKIVSKNSTTHSYTVMPAISQDGTLVGPMLLCLKEVNGRFGKFVKQKMLKPPNLFIQCSKSGKMSKSLMQQWAELCLKPQMTDEEWMLLLDSWTGQKDDKIFESLGNKLRRLYIPPKTTSLIQPLDRYFFRQMKIFVKRISEYVMLYNLKIDLHQRDNVIKLQSLVYNQLQSPSFSKMLQYSWFCSGYIDEHPGEFKSVNQKCFDLDSDYCDEDGCVEFPFMICSYDTCRKSLCFKHFFKDFHTHFEEDSTQTSP